MYIYVYVRESGCIPFRVTYHGQFSQNPIGRWYWTFELHLYISIDKYRSMRVYVCRRPPPLFYLSRHPIMYIECVVRVGVVERRLVRTFTYICIYLCWDLRLWTMFHYACILTICRYTYDIIIGVCMMCMYT